MKNAAYLATGFQPMLTKPELIVADLDKLCALLKHFLVRPLPMSK